MRHTLYKVLICACLILLIFVILIVSLPTVVTNRLFGLDGEQIDESATLLSAYTEMAGAVTDAIDAGYDAAMARVEAIIAEQRKKNPTDVLGSYTGVPWDEWDEPVQDADDL